VNRIFCVLALLLLSTTSFAAEWQWSVPYTSGSVSPPRAFLWIPSDCRHVRAVMVAQRNMIEQGILEHPIMRKTLSELGIAEVWLVPPMDGVFRFDQGAGDRLTRILKNLAEVSGYEELNTAPLIPMGHSACASFPWNCAAWNPTRTLAILSVHGDAPLTSMTGSGHPNPNWGSRNIDGIPGLMVMGEYEWLEGRLTPALGYEAGHPAAPIAFLCDAGHGHFDYSDQLISFLAMFIRKAAAARLPADGTNHLIAVDPRNGWRIDRWRPNLPPTAPAAPYANYQGNPNEAFWCFDQEMADATERYYVLPRASRRAAGFR